MLAMLQDCGNPLATAMEVSSAAEQGAARVHVLPAAGDAQMQMLEAEEAVGGEDEPGDAVDLNQALPSLAPFINFISSSVQQSEAAQQWGHDVDEVTSNAPAPFPAPVPVPAPAAPAGKADGTNLTWC
jgi:hypothetical protein